MKVFSGICMSRNLTKNQFEVLNFLASASNSPSYREIAKHLGERYSASSVQRILERLQKKGFIEKTPKTPRSVRVLAMPESIAA
jgi:DNA-binding MarR family transcriptional regulator